MKRILTMILGIALSCAACFADVRVVATVPNMAMLAREIGGEAVSVRVLAPPDRDAHYLEARPSMMAALRRADLVAAVGAELEIGWLPAAVRGANNPRIQTGRPGYFEAARYVDLLWDNKPADRALGDVHPMGNPHIYFDPERMAAVGYALAGRLGDLKPEKAGYFTENAETFAKRVAARIPQWRKSAKDAAGIISYHSDPDYLLNLLGVPILGHIEPLPGIPPTAAHLRGLVRSFSSQQGVIWTMDFQPARPGEFLARELGWRAVQLPGQVPMDGAAEDYFQMINDWVESLNAAE